MSKNKMLIALLIIGLISTMGICAVDDARQPGRPGGGNPPGWSNRVFGAIDTMCGIMNGPLDVALRKVVGWGAKSQMVVSVLIAYFSYSAKGKVVDDVKNVPGLVKQVVAHNKKYFDLLERSKHTSEKSERDE